MKSIFRILFTVIPLVILTNRSADAQNELDVIRNNWLEYSDAANSLYHHLTLQAFSLLKERENRISVFNTLMDWQNRQNHIRETLADIVGSFPEKTPLNARIGITGRSGGGTQSAYIAAMDDRIYAAAPENYITNYTRVIPYLLFKPAKPDNRFMIYLLPSGKAAEASSGGEIEGFVNKGITVLAPDLIGTGETGTGALRGDAYFEGVSHNLWYASMLIGRSIAGIHAGDVVRLVRLLKKNNNEAEITGFARREMTPVLLHSAAFEPDIENIILSEPYSSYKTIVMNRFYEPHFILSAVPGALKEYDLPDLAGSLAPRRLFISGTTDGNGSLTDSTGIDADLSVIKNAFHIRKADNELMILPRQSEDKSLDQLMEWINKK
ncbi:MAG: hypothetical protein MUO72_08395 [Bacteroidales bacterium]|nr:hypothetical protein [Bacteroidales bacterium]